MPQHHLPQAQGFTDTGLTRAGNFPQCPPRAQAAQKGPAWNSCPEENRSSSVPSWPQPNCGFSETGPLSERCELPSPAKTSTKVSPVALPVPPEATTPTHKELSQSPTPFLTPITHLSAYLLHQPQVDLEPLQKGHRAWLGSAPALPAAPSSHPMCNQVTAGTDPTHYYSVTEQHKGLQRDHDTNTRL